MTNATAKATADWISSEYLPSYRSRIVDLVGDAGSLLGFPDPDLSDRRARLRALSDLSIQLEDIVKRKAMKKGEFLRPLKRTSIMVLLEAAGVRRGSSIMSMAPASPERAPSTFFYANGTLMQSFEWMEAALTTAGRPPTSPQERKEKLSTGHMAERHRKRLKAEQRRYEDLLDFVRSGGTLLRSCVPTLGSKTPCPEK